MSAFSLYSFRDLVFKLTDWTYFQSLQLAVRYGFMNCFRLDRMIEQMLGDFAKYAIFLNVIYVLQYVGLSHFSEFTPSLTPSTPLSLWVESFTT